MIKRTLLLLAGATLAAAVAQATIVDLTGTNTSGTINGAIFQFTQPQPTGTGVIQPFLRLQGTPTEQAYNTSSSTLPWDAKAGPWTHNITLGDLRTTTVSLGGTTYFKLLLDVNEPNGAKSLISLDRLEFYTSNVASQSTLNLAQLGTLRWSLDGGGDSAVILDAARNHGSGSGDMYAFIPTTAFAGLSDNTYVYMFTRFGDRHSADDTSSAGGFEEWALVRNMTPIPEMGALFPIIGLMVAVLSTNVLRRRRMARLAVNS